MIEGQKYVFEENISDCWFGTPNIHLGLDKSQEVDVVVQYFLHVTKHLLQFPFWQLVEAFLGCPSQRSQYTLLIQSIKSQTKH